MKGDQAQPIIVIVKTTFYRASSTFVELGTKAITVLKDGHIFCEELSTLSQEN
ncbi:hypothetical protein SESBI_06461 [Sesbania bispinosa]|nr:hypothetical protein SESBI_06461 [Sesbania bispinosa]